MKEKIKRQEAIKKLVDKKKIGTQEELVAELKKLGYKVTQATISRDISELRLQRAKSEYGTAYTFPGRRLEEDGRLRTTVRQFVESAALSDNLVVMKTLPGAAQGIASALDEIRWDEVVGTVAGDDTILVVAKNAKAGKQIVKKLEKIKKGT